jgi:glycosyltransferase involved in cell wall biosynthesis
VKILQIHNRHRYAGGEDAVVIDEASVLAEAGHAVQQLITSNPDDVLGAGAALLFSPWNPLTHRRVARLVDDTRPDIAHVHNTWFGLTPSILSALNRRGIPVVMTLHNYRLTCANGLLFRNGGPCEVCVEASSWNAVRYGCYRGSRMASIPAATTIRLNQLLGTWTHNIDTFIALTEFQRQIMVRSGIPAERIVVKPNFAADPGARASAPSESKVVLFAGRLSEEKGVRLLLDAWRDASPDGLTLLVAGEGPDRHTLAGNLPSGVQMPGRLNSDELMDLMLKARAMVIPSLWYEGFPRVLAEAFAAGLPTVVPELGAPGEIVTEALGPEWVFRMGARSDLERLLNAIQDDDWCDASGRRARQAYENLYSRELAADGLIQIYEDCLTSRATQAPIGPDGQS